MDEVIPLLGVLSPFALYAIIHRFLKLYGNGEKVYDQLTELGEECFRREGGEGVKLIK